MSPASKKQLSSVLKLTAVVLVVTLGIWGCARKPANEVSNDRLRAIEARCVKLEQDYRTVAQARDKARKELAGQEELTARLQRDLADRETIIKERDDLRRVAAEHERVVKQLSQRTAERDQLAQKLAATTTERDTAAVRFERLRQSIQSIVSQDDKAQEPASGPGLNGNS